MVLTELNVLLLLLLPICRRLNSNINGNHSAPNASQPTQQQARASIYDSCYMSAEKPICKWPLPCKSP